MSSSVAVRKTEKKTERKTPKRKINRKFAIRKPLPGVTVDETIHKYHYFAVKMAKNYIDSHPGVKLEFDDAYSIVCIAFSRAHEKYDPKKGTSFMYYASQWARAYLDRDGDVKQRLIRIPPKELKKYIKEKFAFQAYEGEINPSLLTDASKKLYFEITRSRKKLEELRRRVKEFDDLTYLAHLESPADKSNDSNAVLGDMLTYEGQLSSLELAQAEEIRERLKLCISKLDKREKFIITKRVMSDNPPPLKEIGEKWGVSRERVRQIEVRALKKLKELILKDPVLSNYDNLLEIRIPTEKKLAEPPAKKEKPKVPEQKPFKKAA